MILFLPIIPFLGALAILLLPASGERMLRRITIACCSLSSLLTLFLFSRFDAGQAGYQFVHQFPWLPQLGISYQVGVDGISMVLCLLHALVSFSGAVVSCWPKERLKEYLFFFLLLTGAIYGVFTSLDLFFLYLFYETTLIPLYPMIGIWGSKNKEYGAMKLTIFITSGAVLALFGILAFYAQTGASTFDLIRIRETLAANPLDAGFQYWLAPFLLVGFGVIASLWPLHSWSPIGYATAPTSVSMLHAGVLKKMGPYLIIRIAVTFLPDGVRAWADWLAILAACGILYAGYAAVKQKDLKYMVGFSSVSHMGYVLLGIAAMNTTALSGAVLLMFSHGVMAACTFALIGFLYEQTHVRGLDDFGGLGKKIPFFSLCFIMASMASLGLPGFSNFVSELLVFIGAWESYPVIVALAIFGILVTAVYLLRAVQKVCYGPLNPQWSQLKDVALWQDKMVFILLLGALLVFGLWPQGLLRVIQPAAGGLFS
jgi:NADH-quinone oxidoreductase subunit M